MPEVSTHPPMAVVILNWNGEELLRRFLPSVLACTPPHLAEVVVVDNRSTDGSLKLLADLFPSVRVLTFDDNYGYAGGYNRAVNALPHDYFCLLNSDIEVQSPHWLERPLEIFQTMPSVAALQPKIKNFRARDYFEYAGAAGGYIDRLGYPFCRGRLFGTVEQDQGQYDEEQKVFWASGACFFVRRNTFLQVGGFDENFFAHMEEIDLCWRLQRAGYKLLYTHRSEVFHLGGASLSESNPRKTYLNFRNNYRMLRRNLPIAHYRRVRCCRIPLDLLAATQMLMTGRPRHSWAVLRALFDRADSSSLHSTPASPFDCGACLPDEKRIREVHPLACNRERFLLPVQYYIRRRKTYAALPQH